MAQPTTDSFNVQINDVVWRADQPTQHDTSGKSRDWTDFAFGEPAAIVLPDRTVLVVFWCIQPTGRGTRFVKTRIMT